MCAVIDSGCHHHADELIMTFPVRIVAIHRDTRLLISVAFGALQDVLEISAVHPPPPEVDINKEQQKGKQ